MSWGSPARWLVIWLLTLLTSLVSITLLFSLGLILFELLIYPLALVVGAVLTGLTAVQAANLLVKDGRYTPVEAVILRAAAAAAILTALFIAGYVLDTLPRPPILISTAAAILLSTLATYIACRHRRPRDSSSSQGRRILAWLLLALATVPLVIFFASLLGWAGA